MERRGPWLERNVPNATQDDDAPAQPGRPAPGGHVNGHHSPFGGVVPLRDFTRVVCRQNVELVVLRFLGFGRLAHFRSSLLGLPEVVAARITGYAEQTAFFAVTLAPGTTAGALTVPGTQLLGADEERVQLCVESW